MEPDGSGGLVGTLTILPAFQTATRYVSLSLEDRDGNSTLYSTTDLVEMGLPTTFTTTTNPDAARPVLRTLRLSSTTVDTRRHRRSLRVQLHVTDDSALKAIRVWLYGSSLRASTAHPHLVSGTAADGNWVGRIRVHRWQGNSRAKIAVELTDVVDRFRIYGARKLAAIDQPSHVRIVSREDPAPPTIRLRSVRPTSVDLRNGAQTVTFVALVKDVGSGARRVDLSLDALSSDVGPDSQARLERVSGTAHDGVWKGRVTLQPCAAAAGQWLASVFARDAAEGNFIIVESAFQVINADIVRPQAMVAEDSYQVRRSGPVTIEFDEDVVGVGGENAIVHIGDSRRGFAGDEPTPIAGTWACMNAAGAAVDCSTGPVRTAAFTPSTPMLAGTNHTVEFNPEHHLGLTDLSGNPFPTISFLNFHTA